MFNIEKITGVIAAGNAPSAESADLESEILMFESELSPSVDKFSSSGGWTSGLGNDLKKMNLASYTWTSISDEDDAIRKSQRHLMDLIRYYEGDSDNHYRAKTYYNDRNKVKTYGYGIVNKSGAVRSILLKNGVNLPPKNETEAYKAVIVYLREISAPEIKNNLKISQIDFDSLPNSIKEALLDLHFNKGLDEISKNSKLKNALKTQNWANVLKELVAVRASADKKADNPGLYRRSFSRIILAARDIPKTPEVEAVIKNVYNKAIDSVVPFNLTQKNPEKKIKKSDFTARMDKIYNTYKSGTASKPDAQDIKQKGQTFKPSSAMSLYNLAISVFPDGDKETRVAFVKEVIKLNPSLQAGKNKVDKDGWPVCRAIAAGENILLPDKITVNNKTIRVNAGKVAKAAVSKPREVAAGNAAGDELSQTSEDVSNIEQMMSEFGSENISETKIGAASYDLTCKDFTYTVEDGNTLWRISNSYNIDLTTLKEYNKLTSNTINVGQKIKIPKIVYQIKKGDTLTSISKRLGLSPEVLKDLNSIDDINKIQIGQTIEIPGYPYVVKQGDYLKKIAENAGVSVETLKALNGLKSDNIQPDQKLLIVFNNADYNDAVTTQEAAKTKYYKAPVSGRSASVYPYYRHHYENGVTVATKEQFGPTSSGKLNGKRIIINAGHGFTTAGHDPGTRHRKAKYDESELTYLNAMALSNKLRAQGATVVFIQGGVNLAAEAIKKETSADMMISLHVNSTKNQREVANDRVEIYYNPRFCSKGKTLADGIDKNLDKKHPKNEHYADVYSANHCVTRASGNKIPSVLVEMGFITNQSFRASTNNHPVCTEIVDAISKSVTNYRF